MESRRTGAVVAIGALIVAVVLFIVLSGDDSSNDSSTTTSTTSAAQTGGAGGTDESNSSGNTDAASDEPVITIKDGAAVGGVQDLTFDKGDDIRFEVESDAAYEIHFHGYDVMEDVPANGSVQFDVPGDADGIYEVEIEDTATQIAEITVNP